MFKKFLNSRYCLVVIAFFFLSIYLSGFIDVKFSNSFLPEVQANTEIVKHDVVLSKITSHDGIDEIFENYIRDKQDNADKWMTFMTILSTLLAAFFVYSGFKIDNTVDRVKKAERKVQNLAEKLEEYTIQLEYCMSFILRKDYGKAIDSLTILRNEPFVLRESERINTCNFFLAHCHYERGCENDSLDDLTYAVRFIDDAILAPDHPLRLEIIEKFEELDVLANNGRNE